MYISMIQSYREQFAAKNGEKQWGFTFYRRPVEFLRGSSSSRISGITMEICYRSEVGKIYSIFRNDLKFAEYQL